MRCRGRRRGVGRPSKKIKLLDLDEWEELRGDYTDTEMSIPCYKL